MLIYAMDTSGPTAGVALLRDDVVIYEAVARNKMTHSESIMPMTEEAFLRAGTRIEDVDYFAVAAGPGSFTGVRIGVTAVKGMAQACEKPCIAVDALEAFAKGVSQFDGILCPIQDARAGQVYGAVFEGLTMARLMEDEPLKLEEYLSKADALAQGKKLLFVGEGVAVHKEKITACMGERAVFAPPAALYLRPAAIAAIAAGHIDRAVDARAVKPLYLRAPQAERQKNLLESALHG